MCYCWYHNRLSCKGQCWGSRLARYKARPSAHHDGKDDADLADHLEDTEQGQEHHLEQGVGVDPAIGNVTQELVIRFVLVGHEREEETLDKL